MNNKLVSLRDLANMFGVTPTTVRRWVAGMNIDTYRPSGNGQVFVRENDFLDLVKEKNHEAI